MNISARGPCEPEQADWYAKATHHCRIQTMLWSDDTASAFFMTPDIFLVVAQSVDDDGGCHTYAATEADAQEGQAGEASVEMVDALEDDGESVEEAEENGEVEAGVQAEKEDYRLCKDHPDRPEECDRDYEFDSC